MVLERFAKPSAAHAASGFESLALRQVSLIY